MQRLKSSIQKVQTKGNQSDQIRKSQAKWAAWPQPQKKKARFITSLFALFRVTEIRRLTSSLFQAS
jgi:hypothetical protein